MCLVYVTFVKYQSHPKNNILLFEIALFTPTWQHQTITRRGAVARQSRKDFAWGSESWSQVCVRSPWWNRWPPSVPAASRWCWSCRTGLCHSRWCSGPRWTPRWAAGTDSGRGPPGPAGGPPWWCAPNMGPLSGKGNTPFDMWFAKKDVETFSKASSESALVVFQPIHCNCAEKAAGAENLLYRSSPSHSGLDFFLSKWQWQWRETGTVH